MKIAIPLSEGKLTMHFGHCSEFAILNVDETEKKILKTDILPAPAHQPGLLPTWLYDKGANVIIAGGMGSRAQSLFADNNIKVITGVGPESPEKIVRNYLNGSLVSGENICDH